MQVTLGNNFCSSTLYFTCKACDEKLIVKIDTSEYELIDADKLAQDLNWRRRRFDFNVNLWFCCKQCAFESEQSKNLEKYWSDRRRREVLENRGWFAKVKDFFNVK